MNPLLHELALVREDADLRLIPVHVDANMIHGWPPSLAPFERVLNVWGTPCHHAQMGASRFIPSIPYARLNERLVREYQYLDQTVEQSTTYYYRLGDVDWHGRETLHAPISVTTPDWRFRTALSFASPSPFRSRTKIHFSLASPTDVDLAVYDVAGRLVRLLVDEPLGEGEYSPTWDGRNDAGLRVAGGTYFVKLNAVDVEQTRKLVYLGGR